MLTQTQAEDLKAERKRNRTSEIRPSDRQLEASIAQAGKSHPLLGKLVETDESTAEGREELRRLLHAAALEIAYGNEPDDSFIEFGIDLGAFTPVDVEAAIKAAQQAVTTYQVAGELDKRTRAATKAEAEWIRIRDEANAAIRDAAHERRLAQNAKQTAEQAGRTVAAIREDYPDFFVGGKLKTAKQLENK
ncbi:MAG: hypothetical protein ACE361_19415 [Aureliella sp.]